MIDGMVIEVPDHAHLAFSKYTLVINVKGKSTEEIDDAFRNAFHGFEQVAFHDVDSGVDYMYERDVLMDLLSENMRLRDELESWKAKYGELFEQSKDVYDVAVADCGAEELRRTLGEVMDKLDETREIAWRPFRG